MTSGKSIRWITVVAALVALLVPLFAAATAQAWEPKYQTVDFVNSSRGWVAGLGSTIVRTTNGGNTWTVQKRFVAGAPTINDICFYGRLRGWAVGDGARLYRTTNGGTTWRRITSPLFASGDDFYAVKFVNANKGWIAGGYWSESYLSTDLPHGAVLGTTDGGRSWTTLASSWAGCYTGLDMVSGSSGVLVGRTRVQVDPSTGYDVPFFVETTDGFASGGNSGNLGATTETSDVADVDMVAGGRIVAVGSYQGAMATTPFLFSSPDYGASWTESNPGAGPVQPKEVKMTSSLVGYCVGAGQRSVYKTVNGGVGWVDKPTRYGTFLTGCDFVSSSTGYAVGAYGSAHSPLVIKTTNGARSWTRVK